MLELSNFNVNERDITVKDDNNLPDIEHFTTDPKANDNIRSFIKLKMKALAHWFFSNLSHDGPLRSDDTWDKQQLLDELRILIDAVKKTEMEKNFTDYLFLFEAEEDAADAEKVLFDLNNLPFGNHSSFARLSRNILLLQKIILIYLHIPYR